MLFPLLWLFSSPRSLLAADGEILVSTASAVPAAISPNSDGILDAATISADFQIPGRWGLAVDSEKALAESQRTPFFLDVTVFVLPSPSGGGAGGEGNAVRVLTHRLTVSPVLRPKGTPADTFSLAVPFSIVWDGRDSLGAVVPDGPYIASISATLLRSPSAPSSPPQAGVTRGGPREQTLATSGLAPVEILLDTLSAAIADTVGNVGSAQFTFTVSTVPPPSTSLPSEIFWLGP